METHPDTCVVQGESTPLRFDEFVYLFQPRRQRNFVMKLQSPNLSPSLHRMWNMCGALLTRSWHFGVV